MRIDAHQHFWLYSSKEYSWIDESMQALQNDFLPSDLQEHLDKNKIDGCIAVQARQCENETFFLLHQAEKFSFIKGVVGWVDLMEENVEDRLKYFSRYKKFCGVRHTVQSEPEGFMLQAEFQRGISCLNAFNLPYDVLIASHQLKEAIAFCEQFPDQKFVIDHLAKPNIKAGEIEEWEKQMRDLASNKNIYCKVSGMVTEADWKSWTKDQLKPYLDVVFDAFGTDRLMYGSDWPVCLLAAKYDEVIDIVNNYISEFDAGEKARIMGENAVRFYDLKC